MKDKIYGIAFALGILCMLGLLLPAGARAETKKSANHKAWHDSSSGSWAVEAGAKGVTVGVTYSWKDSHGAMVAGAAKVGDINTNYGTIGWYSTDMKSVSEDETTWTDDHWWKVHKNQFLPEAEYYIEETGEYRKGYYTTTSSNMVHHHWIFDYKVEHEVGEWPIGGYTEHFDDEYMCIIGVHSNA